MTHTGNEAPPTRAAHHGVLHLGHPESHIPLFEIPDIVAPQPTRRAIAIGFVIAAAVAVLGWWLQHVSHGVPDARVPLAFVTPFVLLLAAIATMPFIAKHWWEHNYARVAIALAALVAVFYLWRVRHGAANLAHVLAEYISFIFLLGSLFVVSGGILIRVRARATPLANTVLLLAGAIVANILGTTGASMLLIRPFLRMNHRRLRAYHIVFFIFIVANAGGSLTPIGDPPLFLGYLRGVPFFWVFEHCWPIWLVAVGTLLAVFFTIDTISQQRAERGKSRVDQDDGAPDRPAGRSTDRPADRTAAPSANRPADLGPAVSFYGGANLLFVALIVFGTVLFAAPLRELCMATAACASLATTPRRVHVENHFNYAPIKEVILLFVGIFVTMLPALNYLSHSDGNKLLNTGGQYYFTCGGLSSVLDNAPTYLTFLKSELGGLDDELVSRATTIVKRPGVDVTPDDVRGLDPMREAELRAAVDALVKYHGDRVAVGTLNESEIRIGFLLGHPLLNKVLMAISMGAVLFGACTYIGNGPNFMVKSIAEHAGAPAPGFFTYIALYTLPILLPVLIAIWLIFLR